MNNIALGAVLILTFASWPAVAGERDSMHAMVPTKEQCKIMAERHGMKGDKGDAWVKKCMEMSEKMKSDRGMGEENDMNDMSNGNDAQDPEEGDSGKSGDIK